MKSLVPDWRPSNPQKSAHPVFIVDNLWRNSGPGIPFRFTWYRQVGYSLGIEGCRGLVENCMVLASSSKP